MPSTSYISTSHPCSMPTNKQNNQQNPEQPEWQTADSGQANHQKAPAVQGVPLQILMDPTPWTSWEQLGQLMAPKEEAKFPH